MTVLDVRFSDWIQRGFSLFVTHAAVLLISSVVALAISAVTLGVLAGPMLAGLAGMVLTLMDDRLARPTLNDLFRGFDHFFATLPVTIGFYLLGGLVFLLGFIPYLGHLLITVLVSVGGAIGVLSVFHLVARGVPPRASVEGWGRLFLMNWGPLLGFYILAMLVLAVGALACGIGAVVTLPIYLGAMGAAYRSITQQSAGL